MVGSIAGAGAVSAAAPAPDLVVTAVTVAPGTVAGQQVRFAATIKNTGTAATPAGTIAGVGFQVDGKLVTWADQYTASLEPGRSTTVTAVGGPAGSATWTATVGTHTLRAFVDDTGRIKESNEGNNTRDVRLTAAAGMTHRVQGDTVVTKLAPLNQPTSIATSITGDAYAGCFTADGVLVGGSERFLQTRSVGNDMVDVTWKWQDGLAEVPAGAAQVRTHASFTQLLYAYQERYPFECAAGQTPGFTRFQATSLRTTRWMGSFSGVGAQIASVSTPVDVDFDVQP
ncbi:hypothetical protein GCM10009528_08290 [Kineococcus aurantiacus]